jgi:hypothetical protein
MHGFSAPPTGPDAGRDTSGGLGVDIGRVIISGRAPRGSADTTFFTGDTAQMLRTPEVDGAVETIAGLVELFGGRVWLVSKCGVRVQAKTVRWLTHHRFTERTGIPPQHWRFVRQRPEKAGHCAELGITHFVDDALEVHEALRPVVPHRYLFGPQSGPVPDWVVPTPTWAEADAAIRATLAHPSR